MKLVTKSTDSSYLHVLKELLEANGIPAFIKGENTARVITPFIMTEPSLWIYLDEQIDEALKLVENPDYEVRNKVDMDRFHEVARNITDKPANLNKALIDLGFTMGLILLAMLVLIKLLQWMLN
jgi:hypothetical protein